MLSGEYSKHLWRQLTLLFAKTCKTGEITLDKMWSGMWFIGLLSYFMLFLWDRLRLSLCEVYKMIHYYAFLPILCIIWPACVSVNEKNRYQNNISYTGFCMASFRKCAYGWNEIYTPVMWLRMLQKSQKQQSMVMKTSLLWSFTSRKAEICASNKWAIFHGQYQKSMLYFEFGS